MAALPLAGGDARSGVTWILDGLEVTIVGALSGVLTSAAGLALTPVQVGWTGSIYLMGGVVGALGFGWLTDRFGRKRLFTATLGLYLLATLATGLAWSFASFAVFRALTAAGIGGEGAAMDSAIDELIPARRRGQVSINIHGSFWVGRGARLAGVRGAAEPARAGALARLALRLHRRRAPGARHRLRAPLPAGEPALAAHPRPPCRGRGHRRRHRGALRRRPGARPRDLPRLSLRTQSRTGYVQVARSLILKYPQRTALCITLLATQAFCYNAVFFTYGLILKQFYGVPDQAIGWYLLPFAAGNVLGPLLLGRLFDTIGRRVMIGATYALSGVLLAITGWLFARHLVDASQLTSAGAWCSSSPRRRRARPT